jgi:hypothetical protein
VTWNVRCTLYQKLNYSHYPFDRQRLQITIEPHDIKKILSLFQILIPIKK